MGIFSIALILQFWWCCWAQGDSFTKVGDRTFSVSFHFNSARDFHYWDIGEMICTAVENGQCTHATSVESNQAQACYSQEIFQLE